MGRITFVENVYFENPGEQILDLSVPPHEYETESDEEPYTRRYKLNSSAICLDLNWLDGKAGMLIVRNLSTTGTIFIGSMLYVPPKQSLRCWVTDWNKPVLIYATEPDVKAYVTICPK